MRSLLLVLGLSGAATMGVFACVGDSPGPAETPGPVEGGTGDGSPAPDGSGAPDGGSSDSGGCSSAQVSCNGVCVATASFQTNAKSCGACGHDCLGGACTGGKCQPIPIVTTVTDGATVEPVRNIVIDTTTVYFTAAQAANGGGNPGLFTCPIAGCAAPTLIQQGNAFGLAITPAAPHVILFSVPQDDQILRFDPAGNGGDRTTSPCVAGLKLCVFSGFPQSNAITTDGTTVYWGTGVPGPGGFTGNSVFKVALPNGGASTNFGKSAVAGPAMVSVALDPDDAAKKYLYVADNTLGRILAFATGGTSATPGAVIATGNAAIGAASVVVRNGLVYWASKTGIYSTSVCLTAGCSPGLATPVYSIANATAIIADATNLYFAAGTTLSTCPFASCTAPKALFEGTSANILAITQDSKSIFMGDDHGNVARIAK